MVRRLVVVFATVAVVVVTRPPPLEITRGLDDARSPIAGRERRRVVDSQDDSSTAVPHGERGGCLKLRRYLPRCAPLVCLRRKPVK